MIHEIGRELDALLKARKCPLGVIDGPEFDTTTWGNDRIVIETAGGDRIGPPKRVSHNPKRYATRGIGVQIRIFARVVREGAQPFEHRRKCDHVLDMVLVALKKISATRGDEFEIRSSDYYIPPDLSKSDNAGGCAYQLLLYWDRGVGDIDWQYNADEEGTIGEVVTTYNPTQMT